MEVQQELWSLRSTVRSFHLVILFLNIVTTFFSTDVLSVTGACSFPFVWGLMAGLHCCASHRALFQSRGWLPIVEAPGYSRHSTCILAMQLFNGLI